MSQPKECISKVQVFAHAMWFSVQTSATIGATRTQAKLARHERARASSPTRPPAHSGYGHMAPDPDCYLINLTIMAEVGEHARLGRPGGRPFPLSAAPAAAAAAPAHARGPPTCFPCAQVICTCLLQASLLGVVYARFSAPSRRASTIRFRWDGLWGRGRQ